MLRDLVSAGLLLAVCVGIHATVLLSVLRRVPRWTGGGGFWRALWLLIRIAWWVILAHLAEVTCWALSYHFQGAWPDLESCGYFSIVTYATIGYGDMVPPQHLRLTAGVEGLTGILMCGWSAAFFFAVVDKMFRRLAGEEGQE